MKKLALALAGLALAPTIAAAQEAATEAEVTAPFAQRASDVVSVLQGNTPYAEVFAEAFRNQVPAEQFTDIALQLEGQFGPIIGVEDVTPASATTGTIRIRFERGIATAQMSIAPEAPYMVNGLLLTGVEPINDSTDALVEDVAALPGSASILVTRLDEDTPLIAHNADMPLALGSAFKLYVLSALAQSIADGERSWDDVVPLENFSFPSGMMQDWPEGSPVTLHTLATLMISISDNTATDQLIAVLGREAVEAEIAAAGHSDPSLMLPLMTTRELFLLKSEDDFDGADYLALDEEERRARLAALSGEELSETQIMAAFTGGPNNIDVEWIASGEDVANLMRRLASLEDPTARAIMGVNPAIGDDETARWAYVGYKGGSEPGVLNMSWLLQDDSGEFTVVTIGWSNPDAEVELQTVIQLGMRAIALAR